MPLPAGRHGCLASTLTWLGAKSRRGVPGWAMTSLCASVSSSLKWGNDHTSSVRGPLWDYGSPCVKALSTQL